MNHHRIVASLTCALGLFAARVTRAASLQPVSDWGASGVPATASMYIYVPDKLAAQPPVVVLAHFCGGSASAVFGQAQGGGLIKAADQYGFIVVVPQTSNNCWDVGSTKALTHDGGGDTQAVAEMVKYAITKYQADADRVYATGDSSGGMLTQALMAVYPDIFKGGSAFAGVPAGCWAVGDPDGSWSNDCAGGQVTHTPQEWGDLARAMDPGYAGPRPRVQLFHGDADMTINYNNFKEAIKQWTNVLGLNTDPTSTSTVMLGTHQATRQEWQNACGYVVLDAFTSMGGDHGPSDALFDATYVVPFLALDQTSATDPEVAQCGAGGTAGAGGSGANTAGNSGSAGAATGGVTGAGATLGSGGVVTGGAGATGFGAGGFGAGGHVANGGAPGAGMLGSGGNATSDEHAGTGNAGAANGGRAAGGPSGSGGSAGTPGAAGSAVSSSSGMSNGGEAELPAPNAEHSGCGCRIGANRQPTGSFAVALVAALALARRRRVRQS